MSVRLAPPTTVPKPRIRTQSRSRTPRSVPATIPDRSLQSWRGQFLDCVLLLMFALCIRMVTIGKTHFVSPDEFFYTVIARDLRHAWSATDQLWNLRSIDMLHGPGFPFALTAFFIATGAATIESGRQLGFLLNVLVVPATYCLVRIAGFRRPHAITSALLLAMIPGFWADADRVWSDHLVTLLSTLFWGLAIAGIRRRSMPVWFMASAVLAGILLTKEYLLAPLLLSLPILAADPVREKAWKYLATAAGVTALAILIGMWLLVFCRFMPRASYAAAIVPTRGSQQHERHILSTPDFRKLYHRNLPEAHFPAIVFLLAIAGAIRTLSHRDYRPHMPAILSLSCFAIALVLLVSAARIEFGTRLLYPAFPIICFAAAVGLVDVAFPLTPVVIPILAWLVWQTSVRYRITDIVSPILFWSVIGGLVILTAAAAIAERSDAWTQRRSHIRAIAMGGGVTLVFLICASYLRFATSHHAKDVAEFGKQYGWEELSQELRRSIRADSITLSANPREVAYYLRMDARQMNAQGWLRQSREEIFKQTRWRDLKERRIGYVILTRPELSDEQMRWVVRRLRSLPYLQETVRCGLSGSPTLVVFRIHKSLV